MRMRNKQRKTTILGWNAGSRCSMPTLIWSLVGFLLLLHFYSTLHKTDKVEETQLQMSHPSFQELQVVEEENIQIPPPRGRRSPRAAKRRPKKKTTLIDEFLDENSPIRHVFFPDHRSAVDPTKDTGNDSSYYFPGRMWLDTEGNPIQAHGGGIMYDPRSRMYYWYGEYKDGPTFIAPKGIARVDIIGVSCYSSKNLWTWRNEGIVLAAEEANETHDLHKSNVLERPKVIYNEKTGKYVMWMHIDDANYTKAAVGVAISDYPTGPFDYVFSKRPHGFESRDMTIFKDDDGMAYLVYSSEDNSELHIGPLTEDYLDVTPVMKKILVGQHREAPALFKHDETYYMITSGCTGWAPNEALAHAAESIMGPWETVGNPCIGGSKMFKLTTFFCAGYVCPPISRAPRFIYFYG